MKNILKSIFILIFAVQVYSASAIEKGDFHINLTTNLGHHSFIPTYQMKVLNTNTSKIEKFGFIPGVTLNMDYAASPYFSIGGWFTFSGKSFSKVDSTSFLFDFKYRHFGIGMRGVFHLYQLISEKGNTKLDADKFDVYIPLSIGGGFRLKSKDSKIPEYQKFKGGAIVGSGIGLTYYFVEHIGANLEAGYCEGSYAKIGLAFKF
ncbi:MAG TPA: hypothetical protein PLJ42_05035 [Chitinophagales bacterium]|jgi:hypothetical protein|nr:hypothetical protein [Chitinophagales bacterium]MBP6154064.1 hypothetical protein [Chitinophagales bacterium]HQV78534.1 hypothetical protein [Chitinophagales bacterium]HQW78780.1 hypothetical protein [Chitinophagales bacterium]HRB66654.1 hypothetical protein [Chitinophagales bacterium]